MNNKAWLALSVVGRFERLIRPPGRVEPPSQKDEYHIDLIIAVSVMRLIWYEVRTAGSELAVQQGILSPNSTVGITPNGARYHCHRLGYARNVAVVGNSEVVISMCGNGQPMGQIAAVARRLPKPAPPGCVQGATRRTSRMRQGL